MPPVIRGGQRRPDLRVLQRGSLGASVAFPLQPLAQHLAVAADRLGVLARPPLRRFFIGASPLHLAKRTLALHLFLQDAQRCVHVIIANKDFHYGSSLGLHGCRRRFGPEERRHSAPPPSAYSCFRLTAEVLPCWPRSSS